MFCYFVCVMPYIVVLARRVGDETTGLYMTLRDLQFTEMFIMVEPTLNNENPTQEYIGTTTYNL